MTKAKPRRPPASADLLDRIALEIDQRIEQLRPAVAEREELLRAAAALGLDVADETPSGRERRGASAASMRRASKELTRGSATQRAVVAALEHGSHTVAELALVTAVSAPRIRRQLGTLLKGGAVTRARRGGKAAYALAPKPG